MSDDYHPHLDGPAEPVGLSMRGMSVEMAAITQAMKDDPTYAWSWHCSLTMAYIDEGGDWEMANRAATRFMRWCFGVDTGSRDHAD